MDLVQAATNYKALGLSVIPVGPNKNSAIYWKQYQQEIMSDPVLSREFRRSLVQGIAIVCGRVSGGLEAIDIDSKYDLSATLSDDYLSAICTRNRSLFNQLVIASTQNNGVHFYYRCGEIGRRIILARRPTTDQECLICAKEKLKILIESRGEGEYIIVPPTAGYRFIQGSFQDIATIKPFDRLVLLTIARSFNLYHKPIPIYRSDPSIYPPAESPFSSYDLNSCRKMNVVELLLKHGWVFVKEVYPRTYFRRPGQTDHPTSGDYHEVLNLFTVFTPNTLFEPLKGYRPHAVFAVLECDGDFRRAAKELLAKGYGIAYKDRNHGR